MKRDCVSELRPRTSARGQEGKMRIKWHILHPPVSHHPLKQTPGETKRARAGATILLASEHLPMPPKDNLCVCVCMRRGILRQTEWVCGGAIKLRHTSRRPQTPTLPHLQEISLPHADTQQLHIYGLVWYVCVRVFVLESVSVEILIYSDLRCWIKLLLLTRLGSISACDN